MMQRALRPSALVPRGFNVESAVYDASYPKLPFRKVARFMPEYGRLISSQRKTVGGKNHDKAKNFF